MARSLGEQTTPCLHWAVMEHGGATPEGSLTEAYVEDLASGFATLLEGAPARATVADEVSASARPAAPPRDVRPLCSRPGVPRQPRVCMRSRSFAIAVVLSLVPHRLSCVSGPHRQDLG